MYSRGKEILFLLLFFRHFHLTISIIKWYEEAPCRANFLNYFNIDFPFYYYFHIFLSFSTFYYFFLFSFVLMCFVSLAFSFYFPFTFSFSFSTKYTENSNTQLNIFSNNKFLVHIFFALVFRNDRIRFIIIIFLYIGIWIKECVWVCGGVEGGESHS